jgi:hypothetical protein
MPMACHSIVVAPVGGRTAGSPLVSAVAAVPAMPSVAMAEHVHGDEGNGDQYPDPVR